MISTRRALLLVLILVQCASAFEVETVAEGLGFPWSIAFLPGGEMLVTERSGQLRLIRNDSLELTPLAGVPDVYVAGQGGLFDVRLHPEFERNQLIYLSFAHGTPKANALRVVRGRLEPEGLVDLEVIFTADPWKDTPVHYGGRMAFLADGTLLITNGDGFDYREAAQDMQSLLGKVVRLTADGGVPQDNPFVGREDVREEIWSSGHRNPQGLVVDHHSGRVYLHEHGPRGGDELNLIEAGNNYGWPIATFGLNYTGAYVSPYTEYVGMTQPLVQWTPSIAPAGMALYRGTAFPEWQGDLLVAALVENSIRRLDMVDGEVVAQEVMFTELGERLRAVQVGPDGFLYLLTDSPAGRVIRIRPE